MELNISKCYFGNTIPANSVSNEIPPALYVGIWFNETVLVPFNNKIFVFVVEEWRNTTEIVKVVVSTGCVTILPEEN